MIPIEINTQQDLVNGANLAWYAHQNQKNDLLKAYKLSGCDQEEAETKYEDERVRLRNVAINLQKELNDIIEATKA